MLQGSLDVTCRNRGTVFLPTPLRPPHLIAYSIMTTFNSSNPATVLTDAAPRAGVPSLKVGSYGTVAAADAHLWGGALPPPCPCQLRLLARMYAFHATSAPGMLMPPSPRQNECRPPPHVPP